MHPLEPGKGYGSCIKRDFSCHLQNLHGQGIQQWHGGWSSGSQICKMLDQNSIQHLKQQSSMALSSRDLSTKSPEISLHKRSAKALRFDGHDLAS